MGFLIFKVFQDAFYSPHLGFLNMQMSETSDSQRFYTACQSKGKLCLEPCNTDLIHLL